MHLWRIRPQVLLSLAVTFAAILASCAQEQYPASLWAAQHPSGGATAPAATDSLACTQARAEPLPARLVAMSSQGSAAGGDVVLVSDLFQRFESVCGTCHGPAVDPPGNGGFQIRTASSFAQLMTPAVLAHVTSSVTCPSNPDPTNPADPMPPCSSPNGMEYGKRSETDPVRQFAELVGAWLAAGSPPTFTPPSPDAGAASGDAGAPSLALSVSVGTDMTNLGNCIPAASTVATEHDRSMALDAMFAGLSAAASGTGPQMIGLPEHLSDTDLFTFDSEVLARFGVVAYAPGYPLWSDDAGKLRHVRPPRGKSIQFDKATQSFRIPANTRFYKTFMKQIVDTDGSLRYRKMETRLIVSRPDAVAADGTATVTALFGTYKWNDDETDAVLVETPLNSGRPFADTVFLYHTDEPLAADILGGNPAAPEEQLLEGKAARHYAIPSSARCVQCHMGSVSKSFVLGFLPLQIARRKVGTGGVIEATGPDELTQLQRLIAYGVLTGIQSPDDLVPLEGSEGIRAPRNDYELAAQGYMLGNCAHCHNPRGFPTVQNPVLKGVLDFMPSADGGIFQFPLERYSPRIGRGLSGTTPIPYITPSLMDLPRLNPKVENNPPAKDIFTNGGEEGVNVVFYGPWRSLIYRNVDSSFAYPDDVALYPHMPMNTPGYDPRAKRLLSDWMVSIPAIRKHPEIPEYAFYDDASNVVGGAQVDWSSQPYVEVKPGSAQYPAALAAAKQRLDVLHTGINPAIMLSPSGVSFSRYDDPGDTSDILDPAVLLDPLCHASPQQGEGGLAFPLLAFPIARRPHWVVTDLSLPPGPWSPRQSNWPAVLVQQKVTPVGGCTGADGEQAAFDDEVNAVGLLAEAKLDDVRDFATTPLPFGLWEPQSGCNFSKVPAAGSFSGSSRPNWMNVVNPDPSAPVYTETPGAAVFKMICINCHGPNADANGRMAQNLATMTGGLAQVADFRDGLFGPVGAPDEQRNRHVVFGTFPAGAPSTWTSVTDDDRAARYMAWMALGGTEVQIPTAILQIIAVTRVLDQQRVLLAGQLSANMLSEAKTLCASLLGPTQYQSGTTFHPAPGHGYLEMNGEKLNLDQALIATNGDAELWLRLCSLANPPPVHLLRFADSASFTLQNVPPAYDEDHNLAILPGTLVDAASYPAAPIGNERGTSDPSLLASNEWPWCLDKTGASASQLAWARSASLPLCPDAVVAAAAGCRAAVAPATPNCFGTDEANRWAVRGAVNAGFSVYLYVKSLEASGPQPDYNQCSLLQ